MRPLHRGALTLATGLAIKRAVNYPFDYLLYPVVLIWLGNVAGGAVMIAASMVINVLLIRLYDWSKTDWLLLEKIKQLQQGEGEATWLRRALRAVRSSRTLTFLVLCIDDPVTVTLFFREGSYRFDGLQPRDWRIFLAATVVSNLYWIVGWALVIELGKRVIATW